MQRGGRCRRSGRGRRPYHIDHGEQHAAWSTCSAATAATAHWACAGSFKMHLTITLVGAVVRAVLDGVRAYCVGALKNVENIEIAKTCVAASCMLGHLGLDHGAAHGAHAPRGPAGAQSANQGKTVGLRSSILSYRVLEAPTVLSIALSRQGQLAAWAARRRCHADYKHEERGRADLDQPDSMRHARIAQGARLPHCPLPSPRRDAAGRPRTPTEPAAALRAVRQRTATHSAQQR